MFKRILALAVASMTCLTMMASCTAETPGSSESSGNTSEGDSSTSVKEESQEETSKTKLSFWTFQDSHQSFMKKMAEEWNKDNPDRQIDLEVGVYSYDDNHNNLLIALQSQKGAPDIVDIEIGRFANYLKGTPQLVPMNEKLEPLKDKLIMSRFENYAKDGNYYGMDYHVGIPVIYYNTEIIDAAGVNIDEIKTWDQYIEAGKTVVEKTGKPMTTLEIQEHWSYYPLVTQKKSDWLDAEGNVILDNKENEEVLQMLYDMMYTDEIAVAAPGGFHHAEEYYAFMNDGGAASVWMPQWYMNRFTDYMEDLKGKIAVRPMPRFTEDGPYGAGMGGTGTAVTNQCQEQDLALDFLIYAKLSDKGAVATWTDLGFDPLRWDVWTLPEMKTTSKFTEYYGDGVFDMLVTLKDSLHAINIGEKFPNAQTVVQSSVVFKVLSEKSMTPAEALKAAAEELKAQ